MKSSIALILIVFALAGCRRDSIADRNASDSPKEDLVERQDVGHVPSSPAVDPSRATAIEATAIESSTAAPAEAGDKRPQPAGESYGLHNLLQISDRFYIGGEPHGDAAVARLAEMGVTTVVSVDGARPDIESARRHGLRYIHIPIGYDGLPDQAEASFARLVREVDGPFYFHCHHGKHRGPAAAVAACVAAGELDSDEATQILVRAGTSKTYAGLWRDVAAYAPPPPGSELPALVEVADVGSLAAAMAQVDRGFDNLKLCREAAWQSPPDHPDVVPAQEALLVKEALHEAGRHLGNAYDELFPTSLTEAESLAQTLEERLTAGDAEAAETAFISLDQNCRDCHAKYRD